MPRQDPCVSLAAKWFSKIGGVTWGSSPYRAVLADMATLVVPQSSVVVTYVEVKLGIRRPARGHGTQGRTVRGVACIVPRIEVKKGDLCNY